MNRKRGWTVDVTHAWVPIRIWGSIVVLAVALLGSIAIAQRARPAAPDIPTIENPLLAQSDAEAKILSVLDDLDKNQRKGMMNVPLEDGRLLRLLTESMGAKRVVEIGTSNGYSGIWFCLALRKTGGHLITHELRRWAC